LCENCKSIYNYYTFAEMKFLTQIIPFFILLLFISSCSDYQKIVKGDDYEAKFEEANRQFERENYPRAIALYEQVYQRFPRTDKGEVAYFRIGRSYFAEKDYYMAGYYFNQYTVRYPLSDNAEEALFLTAICSVNNSPSSTFDQEETEIALNDLQLFVLRYPNSHLVDSCNRTMDRLRFKIETKRFDAVKLYARMEDHRAAVASSKSFIENYPRSFFMKEATLLQFENSYKLAMNSILSRKQERIEDAMETYARYNTYFVERKSVADRTLKMNEDLQKELLVVEEEFAFNSIIEAYENSNSSSQQKKIRYLEETIVRFNIFADKYANSNKLERARSYQKRAERELNNI